MSEQLAEARTISGDMDINRPRKWVLAGNGIGLSCISAMLLVFGLVAVLADALACHKCGSMNPALGYGPAPYGGSWATDHRDGRNSDFADCEVNGLGYAFAWEISIDLHTNYAYPVIGPEGTAWVTVNDKTTPTPATTYLYGIDIKTGEIKVKKGVADGVNYTASWNAPTIDKAGNIYLSQELARPPETPCRFGGQSPSKGDLCGELLAYDPAGKPLWRIRIDGATLGLQINTEGKLVFQTWRGTIYVVDPDPAVPDSNRIISVRNTFPHAAETLPNYMEGKAILCLSMGIGDQCITGNIVAIHPQTNALYNTVQGFVKNSENSFVQRWIYNPQARSYQLDRAWDTSASLPVGSSTSPDISFDNNTIFVNDRADGMYALDAVTGRLLASQHIFYPAGGSPGTAPEVDLNGRVVGAYVMPFGHGKLSGTAYATLLNYRPESGFRTIKVFDGRDGSGVAWQVGHGPISGIDSVAKMDPQVRYIVQGLKTCESDCPGNNKFFFLQVDAATGELLSTSQLVGDNLTGLMSLGPDGSLILNNKGRLQVPSDYVTQLMQRYDPLAEPVLNFSNWAMMGRESSAGPAVAIFGDAIHMVIRGQDPVKSLSHKVGSKAWVDIGGETDTEPALVSFKGSLWAFIRGMDNRIYFNEFRSGSWLGWQMVLNSRSTPSAPTVTVFNNQLYLFIQGMGNDILSTRFDGSVWSDWSTIDGQTMVSPGVTVYQNTLYIMVKDLDKRLNYAFLGYEGIWSAWMRLNGTTDSRPALASFKGNLYVFIRGANNEIYYSLLQDGIWRNWSIVDGKSLGAPSISTTDSRLFLAIRDLNSSVDLVAGRTKRRHLVPSFIMDPNIRLKFKSRTISQ